MRRYGQLTCAGQVYRFADVAAAAGPTLQRLPWLMRILLENVLRQEGPAARAAEDAILAWIDEGTSEAEIPFMPGRVLMHDTTCGPALVDIAGMRSALAESGYDPNVLNPVLPVDVSTDHSVAVDAFGTPEALTENIRRDYARNGERYSFVKWAAQALSNFRVHPPGTGIMHTLNLERLASVVTPEVRAGDVWLIPDTLIGTDSHTPMINGIGVLAWGVGGLEAESVMFGMPVMMRVPDIIGVRLRGTLQPGVLATDLALTVTELLRRVDLADWYVEFFGPGVSTLSAGDRAVVANMTPEFGANTGYFAIDDRTLAYLRQTGRADDHLALIESYARRQGFWFDPDCEPRYTQILDLDLSAVEISVAGPVRPQDRHVASATAVALGSIIKRATLERSIDRPETGAVAIAAITSCTNTSDPRLLIAAALLSRKAAAFGLRPPPWVKTSLAPGSPTTERYLSRAGLLADLEAVGFAIVGYGCTTCIGNSGQLKPEIDNAIRERAIVPVAVLSGNRNFPGRVHPSLVAGFLASPPMVVAFALAGDVATNIMSDPIGRSSCGRDIYLSDLWPSGEEIDAALAAAVSPDDYAPSYAAAEASEAWHDLAAPSGPLFPWDETSTYIRRPPFAACGTGTRLGSYRAHPIIVVGDDITTDHISPAGQVPRKSEAADYLIARREKIDDLNVFAARRGNWEVMVRGLFSNRTVQNYLGPDVKPGCTVYAGTGEQLPLWTAADRYAREERSVVVIAGERYGMGSSRDWAAKGVGLLGVRAVLANSFERIHRSNLIGMGILPLRLPKGITPKGLKLSAEDEIEIIATGDALSPKASVPICIRRRSGRLHFKTIAAIETTLEIETLRAGGILPLIMKRAMGQQGPIANKAREHF